MRIGIIATSLIRRAQTGGMATYTRQLIKHLVETNKDLKLILFLHPQNLETFGIQHPNVQIVTIALPPRQAQFWEQFILPIVLLRYRNSLDLIHTTAYGPLIFSPIPSVATVHDLTYRRVSGQRGHLADFYWKCIAETGQRQACRIITISENSKSDLVSLLGFPPSQIVVIPEAAEPIYHPISREMALNALSHNNTGLSSPYLLFISSLDPHKNIERLIKAYDLARKAGITQNLIIVGQMGKHYESKLSPLVKRLYLEDDIQFLGRIPYNILPALYSAADALVFPSLYEGFGLPILEAMACGTPVLTSDNSSLAEIAGDAALLVDPMDIIGISQGIISLCHNADLRHELSKRGLERAKLFSWQRCASETYEVYEKCIEEKR